VKTGDPFLVRGTAARIVLPKERPLTQLATRLERLSESVVLICGDLAAQTATAPLVTAKALPEHPGAVARTKKYFGYTARRPVLVMLDHDGKDLPPELRQRLDAAGGLVAVLTAICPEFAKAGVLLRPSCSTGIRNRVTGAITPGGSLHLYFVAKDGADITTFVKRLHERLVLNGWGWAFISKRGHIHVRSLIDVVASGSSYWLCFEENAVLAHRDLEHVQGARRCLVERDGVFLDTKKLPELDKDEHHRLAAITARLRAAAQPEADRRKALYIATRAADLEAQGFDPVEAKARASRVYETQCLDPSDIIVFDDGRVVAGADILRNPKSFNRATGADPLEPDYGGGRNKALWLTDRMPIECRSFAHGGIRYTLGWGARDLIAEWKAHGDEDKIAGMWPLTILDDPANDEGALAAANVPTKGRLTFERIAGAISSDWKDRLQRTG
jgi:hypothetical protein